MSIQITDAVALNFLSQQTRTLSNRAFDEEYDIFDYQSIIPVNTDYPEWSSGADFQVGSLAGAAKWQSGWAQDVPLVDVSLVSVGVDFAMYAAGYRYNVEELGKAMHAGYPLTARKAIAARQAADIFVAETALTGGGHPGWTGLVNSAGVTPALSPDNGTGSARNWVDANGVGLKTPEQIVSEMNRLLMGPPSATGILPSSMGNAILLPSLAYQYIATTAFGPSRPGVSILEAFVGNNVYSNQTGSSVIVRELPALADAATDSAVTGQGRAVGYRNNLDSIELPMPKPFEFQGVHQHGPLQWEVPGIGRIGQLAVLRDGALRYLDGVTPAP